MKANLSETAKRILDKVQYFRSVEWQVLHSTEQEAVKELAAAGLVHQSSQYVVYGRGK